MKEDFKSTPPIPEYGDGLHRIVSAKELGYRTILVWEKLVEEYRQEFDIEVINPVDYIIWLEGKVLKISNKLCDKNFHAQGLCKQQNNN